MQSRGAVKCAMNERSTAALAAVFAAAGALVTPLAAQEPPPAAGGSSAVGVTEAFFPESSARAFPESGAWLPVYLELKNRSTRTERVSIEGSGGGLGLGSARARRAGQV